MADCWNRIRRRRSRRTSADARRQNRARRDGRRSYGGKSAMKLRWISAACGILLATWMTLGQNAATLSTPSLGYIWNSIDGQLRGIRGMAGNAFIDAPIRLSAALFEAFSLDERHFLITAEGEPN